MTSLVLVDEDGTGVQGHSHMRKVPLTPVARFGKTTLLNRLAGVPSGTPPAAAFCATTARRPHATNESAIMRLQAAVSKNGFRERDSDTKTEKRSEAQLSNNKKNLLLRAVSWLRRGAKEAPYFAFDGFAWYMYGDALLASDFTMLNSAQIKTMKDLAEKITARSLQRAEAWPEDVDKNLIALGYIALVQGNKSAQEFIDSALIDAPRWIIEITWDA
jgi:hypothetical protein